MSTEFPGRLERFLLITLLTSFALVQPLLDLLGKQAEFLVAYALEGSSLLMLVALLAMVVPLAVSALLAGLSALLPGYRRGLFHGFFVVLGTLITLPFLGAVPWPGSVVVLIGLSIGVLVLLGYFRFHAIRLFFKVLTPAVLIFPLVFLLDSRASPLVFSGSDAASTRSATLETSPDIIFLVLDEFPLLSLLDSNLHIDAQRFPNFARLASMSHWYPGATTGAEVTTYAVPEALSGREADPGDQRLPISANYPDNLFSLLAGRYEMNVMETATHLCPRNVCAGAGSPAAGVRSVGGLVSDLLVIYAHLVTPSTWAAMLPSMSDGWSGFSKRQPAPGMQAGLEDALVKAELSRQIDWRSRSVQFRRFIESIEPGTQARLFYLHMLLPHRIWQHLPDGRQYLVSEVWEALDPPNLKAADLGNGRFGHSWQNDEWAVAVARERHLLQVQFVDHLLGELLDRLEDLDMLADSMLVMIGDHGAGFVPGQPLRAITPGNSSDIAAVPLFIKQAGQTTGAIVEGPARLIDIFPTILESLNASTELPLSGASLLDKDPPSRDEVIVKHAGGGQLKTSFKAHMEHLAKRAEQLNRVISPAAQNAGMAGAEVSSMLGKSPADFKSIAPAGVHAAIDAANLFDAVRPQSEFIPAHIRGSLSGPAFSKEGALLEPVLLAVSVNGRIESITRSYLIDGFSDRFEALLPPASLLAGRNTLEIFRISQAPGGLALQALSPNKRQNWVLRSRDGEEILQLGERGFPLQPGAGAGHVLSLPTESGALFYLVGNAASGPGGQPTLIAFLDGEYAGEARIEDRVYSIAVAPGSILSAGKTQVRVFAVREESATAAELDYPARCDPAWQFAPPAAWGDAVCQLSPLPLLEKSESGYSASLDFGDPAIRPYLLDGWQLEEGGISWTLGQSASLEIPLPPDVGALQFTASIKPFLSPPGFDHQALWLLANGQPVQSWSLQALQFEEINWTVTLELLALDPQNLKLTFLLPDAASPAAIGAGDDIRILGMAVQRIDIRGQ